MKNEKDAFELLEQLVLTDEELAVLEAAEPYIPLWVASSIDRISREMDDLKTADDCIKHMQEIVAQLRGE